MEQLLIPTENFRIAIEPAVAGSFALLRLLDTAAYTTDGR